MLAGVLPLTGFVAWTVLVTQGTLAGIDHTVARWALQTNTRDLDRLAAIGSSLFGVAGVALFTLIVCAYNALQRRPRLILALLLALFAGGLAERGIRAVLVQPTNPVVRSESFERAAPESVVPAAADRRISVPALGIPDARHSYPSGHLTLAAVLCAAVALTSLPDWRARAAYIAMPLLLLWGGWSEIYRGTHLFSDVAGALLMGAAVTLLCHAVVERAGRR
jgi:membrane-associated phospholipid phosphatase